MSNITDQTIVLAKLNEVLDMQLFVINRKNELDVELKKLEKEGSKKDE